MKNFIQFFSELSEKEKENQEKNLRSKSRIFLFNYAGNVILASKFQEW